jgi:hypothetical protein
MAIDAKTGKVLWRTYSVPGPGEPGVIGHCLAEPRAGV